MVVIKASIVNIIIYPSFVKIPINTYGVTSRTANTSIISPIVTLNLIHPPTSHNQPFPPPHHPLHQPQHTLHPYHCHHHLPLLPLLPILHPVLLLIQPIYNKMKHLFWPNIQIFYLTFQTTILHHS